MIAHEFGHAGFGLLVGIKSRLILIGEGRTFWRIKLGKTRLVVRTRPYSGCVAASNGCKYHWCAEAVFAAGGIFSNSLLAIFCIVLIQNYHGFLFILAPIVLAQLSIMGKTLFLSGDGTGDYKQQSDGLHLWRIFSGTKEDILENWRETSIGPLLLKGQDMPAISRYWPEITDQMSWPVYLDEAWAWQESVDVLRKIIQHHDLPEAEKILILIYLCGRELLYGGTDVSLADMDGWSATAFKLSPTMHPCVTRGGVLAALGYFEEARDLLLPIVDQCNDQYFRVSSRAILGQAFAGTGDHGEARGWFARAREFPEAHRGQWAVFLACLERDAFASTEREELVCGA